MTRREFEPAHAHPREGRAECIVAPELPDVALQHRYMLIRQAKLGEKSFKVFHLFRPSTPIVFPKTRRASVRMWRSTRRRFLAAIGM